ncbi:hypothetical protein WJX72_005021 [[Myrmecia] bisecta]|uniref:Calcium-transporting ATPase n=1 Tax=[Myrmecia] bisecta TaxID=41462 RepID=A0AAW1R744_9CHLO
MNENKDKEALSKHGGIQGMVNALASNVADGLSPAGSGDTSIEGRQQVFGANRHKTMPAKNFFRLMWEIIQDPTIILLMAAALVSTVLGAVIPEERENSAWSEGVAIWVAVAVVTLVGAGNDYQKDQQFRKLNAAKDIILVKVRRGGQVIQVENTDVVVGDIMVLDTGDKIVADGLLLHTYGMVVDEASLTGESEPIKKTQEVDPWLRSGTQLTEGSGSMLVVAVGEQSEWGRTMAMVMTESGETPLQEHLAVLAGAIGKVGLGVAAVCFVVLLVRWCIEEQGFPLSKFAEGPLQFFIFCVTIVVVAVPEGLPLAVTISLAYSMKKMMKDNNFVRVLAACETMGGATAICSDKTGTLTENRMTVVEGWFGGKKYPGLPPPEELHADLRREIQLGVAINSKAFLMEHEDTGKVDFVGNRTECALLMMLRAWGVGYDGLRKEGNDRLVKMYGFSSEKKMASCLVRTADGFRLYNKGAAEIVLSRCISVFNVDGSTTPMTPGMKEELMDTVTEMAQRGLRTLCLTFADFPGGTPIEDFESPPDDNLTCCCIVGIKDPVRKEVPDAVATCKKAGIFVRMVTGDNVHTAKHIARECGILSEGGIALEGPIFRNMPEEELIPILPKLQVLARSSPTDKHTLVKLLQKTGEVVAVTGDGTNDAPALKQSDVGLAMGIAGTDVAKEAADIVIMDDNFSSIVKSVLWGRSVFNNLRKFLQFQLTVNFVALVVAFVAAVTNGETPLNVLQLLWVNLIMDSMAALALATEEPTPKLLLQKPHGRHEKLISPKMWKHIITQGLYQIFILFLVIYGAPAHLNRYRLPTQCHSMSSVSGHGRTLTQLSVPSSNATWNPAPVNHKHIGNHGLCSQAPCINLCCEIDPTTKTCRDNRVDVDGGYYKPGEIPMCGTNSAILDELKRPQCSILEPEDNPANFCQGETDTKNCARYQEFRGLYDGPAHEQFKMDVEEGREKYNSIVFNAFIFMQLFNEINARKINDEYNVFQNLHKSTMFIYIIIITVILQVIIMLTPVSSFFKVQPQNAGEWLFAIATGVGALIVALVVKFVSRTIWGRPQILKSNSIEPMR